MKRVFVSFLLIASFFLSGFIQQQNNQIEITRMQVKIWPEYDRREVLVIHRLQLSEATTLPIQVSFRIPREVGSPYKVAMIDLDGMLYNLEYTLIPEGVWNRVVFTTSSAELQIEYYDPRLTIAEDKRSFSYSWIGDYPVDVMQVSVQKPRSASNLTTFPELGAGAINPDDRLIYYSTTIGKVETGISFNLLIQYTKTTDDLSATNLPVVAATPVEENGGLKKEVSNFFNPILDNRNLIIAEIFILGSLLLFLVVSMLAGDKEISIGSLFRRTVPRKPVLLDQTEQKTYCPQCGNPIRTGDHFCRVCGSQLK